MSFISVFDVLGPNMIGPSSSHTAGACSIGLMARRMLGGPVSQVQFTLYGSFSKTYKGHGTDRALLGGIMGFSTDDPRIPEAYALAEARGLRWRFDINDTQTEVHPNTVDIDGGGKYGTHLTIRGESLGGGKIRIVRIDGIEVDFTGEYDTLIVVHKDQVGMVAYITSCLSESRINIAFMKLFREAKGDRAYSIIEFDGYLPEAVQGKILEKEHIEHVMLIQTESHGNGDEDRPIGDQGDPHAVGQEECCTDGDRCADSQEDRCTDRREDWHTSGHVDRRTGVQEEG